MKKGKTKLTRHDAERLFEGLPAGNVRVSSRPENPFEAGVFDVVKRVDDENKLWKDSLITLPMAIELPAGYESVSRMREAMVRASVFYVGQYSMQITASGGSEFGANQQERLRERVAVISVTSGQGDLRFTFSAGVAGHRLGQSVDDTIVRADRALYKAKAAARNRVEFADDANDA
jgi:hypothetical protein